MTRKRKPSFPPANQYQIFRAAAEQGVAFGVSRWLKYRDEPIEDWDREALEEHLVREVLNEICERFEFD